MASGTIALTRTGSGYLTGQILWSSQSNGSAANTSTVTAKLQIQRSALNSTTGTFTGSFKVGSTSKTISWYGTLPTYEWVTIETVTATVGHNADGKGSCYLYALVNGPTQTTMEGTYVSGSATVTLDAIPRFAEIVSATKFTDEGNPTITYSNPAGNAVELLQACISLTGSNADVPYRDIPKTGTKYTFSLTESERNTLRAASPNSCTLTVHVYIRSTIGGSTQTDGVACRMSIVNANPVVSSAVVDTNSVTTALTGSSSSLVALYSKAKVTISATAQKYATIKSKRVEHGAASLSGDGTLSVTNNPIKITVTDSRGNQTEQTATNTIVPYIDPTCAIGNNLPEAGGDFSLVVSGLFYNGAIGKTTNTLEVQYRYKAAGGSYGNWTTFATVAKKGNSYTATAKLTGLDYQTVYTFQARVIDAIHDAVNVSSVYSAEKAVVTEPVFDWGENDFRFNVPVNLKAGCDIFKNGSVVYKVFTKLTDIGITAFPTTMKTVANSMHNNSALILDSRDIIAGGNHEISDLGIANAGMYMIMRGNSNARISLLHIYGATGATTSYMNYGCYAATNDEVIWIRGERQNANYPDCRFRTAADGNTEWINTPMLVGTEYRTTERYMGKIVYAKLVNFGALPNNTTKQVGYCSDGSTGAVSLKAIFADGNVVYGGTGKDLDLGKSYNLTLDCTKYNIRICTDYDFSSRSAYVLIKYTLD